MEEVKKIYLSWIVCVVLINQYGARVSAQNCIVDNLSVQDDFDFDKYMGMWYEISWYPNTLIPRNTWLTEYLQTYVPIGDGNATVYTQGRKPEEPTECIYDVHSLTSTNTPGKLVYTSPLRSIPYWVLETDYTQYALAYGCYNISSDGTCGGAAASVWSRTASLPQSAVNRIQSFYERICVPATSFENITHNETCSFMTNQKLQDDQNCTLTNLEVQDNLDLSKFMGKWYIVRNLIPNPSYMSTLPADVTHHYIMNGDGNVTGYTNSRLQWDSEVCHTPVITLLTTITPGKLIRVHANGYQDSYWILRTDYSQYAVTFSCYLVNSDGSCEFATSDVWSRTPSLSKILEYEINRFLQHECVNPSAFATIKHENECGIKTHEKIRENQDCNVTNIPIQDDFQIDKYRGTWYETRLLAPSYIPVDERFVDYQHHYIITGDGNITGYLYGRSSESHATCFYKNAVLEKTSTPGKFFYTSEHDDRIPYWVIRTDYTQYAVVYGCYNVSSDGSCYQARSWVWSRTPTLPKHLEYDINTLLQDLCVNPTAYLSTQQENACRHELVWKMDDQMDCNVTRYTVKSNFNVTKFTRVWYETHWLPKGYPLPSDQSTDRQEELTANAKGDLTSYIRHRKGDVCHYTTTVYKATDTPGKYMVPLSSRDSYEYWVADTDYENYAVMYGCERVGSDGGCLSARGSVWSRSLTLSLSLQYKVNAVFQGLCINPLALVTTKHERVCSPQKIKDCPPATGSSGSSSRSYFTIIITLLCVQLH